MQHLLNPQIQKMVGSGVSDKIVGPCQTRPLDTPALTIEQPIAPPTASRKRPLRTYGKRNHSARDATPPTKKRRLAGVESTIDQAKDEMIVRLPSPTPDSPPRSSILRYFKRPAPVSDSSTTTATTSQTATPDAPNADSSPPTSPTLSPWSRPRSRRRLTTRLDKLADLSATDEIERLRSTKIAEARGGPDPAQDDSLLADRPSLGEKHLNTLGRKPKKPGAACAVQTTLSLTSASSFTQCKECEMLYNPLHPKDAKHHTRHHAVFLRERVGGLSRCT